MNKQSVIEIEGENGIPCVRVYVGEALIWAGTKAEWEAMQSASARVGA